MSLVEPPGINYARGTTVATPLSAWSIAMLTIGMVGLTFLGGCFCIGLLMMFAPANTGMGPIRTLEWNAGQRVVAGILFAFAAFCLVGAVSLLSVLVRRVSRGS